jgi:hypothetical protein
MYYATKAEVFGLSRAEAGDLTYREFWETYLEPHLRERGELKNEITAPADAALLDLFADQICEGRKYEGEKWWIPLINYDANPGLERPK